MAQILSIYGLVISVIISGGLNERMALHTGFLQLGAGLAVGLCGLSAGFAIGIVGDAGGAEYPFLLLFLVFVIYCCWRGWGERERERESVLGEFNSHLRIDTLTK